MITLAYASFVQSRAKPVVGGIFDDSLHITAARRTEFWRLQPHSLRMPPTCEEWYETWNWRRITSVTWGRVQMSPR